MLSAALAVAELADQQLPDAELTTLRGGSPESSPPLPPITFRPAAARAWFETEIPHLLNGLEQACRHHEAGLAWALADRLLNHCVLSYRYLEARRAHELALSACVNRGELRGQAVMHRNLAYLYSNGPCGGLKEAGTHAQAARRLFRELDEPIGEAESLTISADTHRLLGHLGAAHLALQRALALGEAHGHRGILARAWGQIGAIHRERGENDAARAAFVRSLTEGDAAGTALPQISAFRMLGALRMEEGDLEAAADLLNRAVQLARTAEASSEENLSLIRLGQTLARQGTPRGWRYLHQGLATSRERNDMFSFGLTLAVLGELELSAGDTASALEHLQESVRVHDATGGVYGQIVSMELLGDAQAATGDLAAAAASWRRSRQLAQKCGMQSKAARSPGLSRRTE